MGATALFLIGSVCLVITVQAQGCSKPVGNPNTRLSDTDILLQTFPDGTQVSFVCEVGYSRAGGSTQITCTAGVWSTLMLRCERKNCGALGEVSDGLVDYPEGTYFGDKAVISCNDGYMLVGRKEITCGDKGWDSRLPTCQEVTCDPPPVVTDATFSPDKETYGNRESVKYTCKSGYTLNGTAVLFCSNGGFTPDPPTCVRVQCYEPNVANADWVSGSRPPYGYLSAVTYQCKPGYKMNGESTLTCGIDSQWLPRIPTCEKVLTTTTASTTTTTSNTPHSSKKPTASTPAATTTANTPVTPKTPTNTPVTPKTPTNTPVTPKTPTNTPVTPKTPTNTPVTPKTPTGPVTPTPPTDRGITHIVVPIVVVLVSVTLLFIQHY